MKIRVGVQQISESQSEDQRESTNKETQIRVSSNKNRESAHQEKKNPR